MVLATVIRIELAYPGVGILAGDNSQYLSIVTAHGVIMVFFMAMPLLFGFFTNFLLPTQLGVHDVAFPRMNSAAFWFLPASLIILCQLVCIDRRYQRMNCFNVKELQSLVRKRFFFELINSNDYRLNLNKSLIGLKYQTNTQLLNKSNSYIITQFGLNYNLNARATTLGYYDRNKAVGGLKAVPGDTTAGLPLTFNKMFNFYTFTPSFKGFSFLGDSVATLKVFINYLLSLLKNFRTQDFQNLAVNFNPKISLELFNSNFWTLVTIKQLANHATAFFTQPTEWGDKLTLNFNLNSINSHLSTINLNYLESYATKRYLQNEFPSLAYKVKIGNYLPETPFFTNFNHLWNTINQKTVGNRKSPWFNSDLVSTKLFEDFTQLKTVFNVLAPSAKASSLFTFPKKSIYTSHMDIFNFYNILLNQLNLSLFNSKRWVSFNYLDQKFINLFFAQSKQSLVLNNWKNLKLTREGWRCRMLLARNQNSLYRKYINENELIWVVEKNAKDLLPGWAMITPFSSRTRYTLIGKTDIGVMVVLITLIASMVSGSNFLITYRYLSTLNNRKMRDARSFFVEAIIATCWMTVAANPMLILGLFMLICDRHWKTSFFDYSGGGDTVLFQHMFWFFGHPEVYIIIVPCFGFINTMLSFYLRKRISARASLMYSMYTIAFLGFFVWGHHMYMVGLAHTTRMLYSTLTVMISVPAATKIMHWLVTFINSSIHFELPLWFVVSFIFFFLSGGISGMAVAHTGMDVLFHDTFYVIGHFHVMLAGSLMFAGFGACYFYLPAIFGVRYNRLFAYLHYIYYTIGQIFTVIPMMWLGYAGMPRRVLDYPAALGGWHSISTSAHILSIAGILCFIIMLFDSIRKKRAYIIKTFGVGRYNTRLNFYIYEINRNKYWLYKNSTLLSNNFYKNNNNNYNKINNFELYDSTLFFYYLKK
jgi:heme/copper-type cytochrome/quinol oxidase subunit 1